MANGWKPSRSIRPEKSAARSVAVGSFPSLTLMAISQAEAALTISVFLVSAMIFRAARVSAGSSESHHSKAWVSSSAASGLLPGRQFANRKGFKKLRSNTQLAFQRSWLAFTFYLADRNQSGYRF